MTTEKTFVMLKHDSLQRNLIGEAIGRFERVGLKLVAMKMMVPDLERATKHYGKDDAWCERKGQKSIENMMAKGETPTISAIAYGRDIVDSLLS